MEMREIVIRTDDVPNSHTLWSYIESQTNVVELFGKLDSQPHSPYELTLDYPIEHIQTASERALQKYGSYGWLSSKGRSNGSYKSLSLTHNPHINDSEVNEFNSTLGSSGIDKDKFFYGKEETYKNLQYVVKNSYYDSYAFNQPNAVISEYFNDFYSHFKRTMIRSRLSIIESHATDSMNPKYMLHKDEPVYENIRINIPVTGSPDHYLQINNTDTIMIPGYAYTWDTHEPHRVYGVNEKDRINLVLGFSPWFDYHPEEDIWVSNEYYGECHPIEMVKLGYVIERVWK